MLTEGEHMWVVTSPFVTEFVCKEGHCTFRTLFSRHVHCCEKALVTRLIPSGPRMVVNQRPKYWGAAPQCFGGVNGGMRMVQGGFCLTNAFST